MHIVQPSVSFTEPKKLKELGSDLSNDWQPAEHRNQNCWGATRPNKPTWARLERLMGDLASFADANLHN